MTLRCGSGSSASDLRTIDARLRELGASVGRLHRRREDERLAFVGHDRGFLEHPRAALTRPHEVERTRSDDSREPRSDAAACSVEARCRAPNLGEGISDDFLGIGVLANDRARERERHAAVPIVQVAESTLVTAGRLSDERRVRGLDPCRVSRHNLQKLLPRRVGRNVGAE